MEKINYVCNEKELNYTFPKRKWYQKRNRLREVKILLPSDGEMWTKGYVGDILLTIKEEAKKEITIDLYEEDKMLLYLAATERLPLAIRKYQELIIFDGGDTKIFIELLPFICQNLNKLSIITDSPFDYEEILEQIFDDTGLIADCSESFVGDTREMEESQEEKPYYKRQKYLAERTLIVFADYKEKLPVHLFCKNSTFFHITFDKKTEREITVKRPDIQYFSISNFLDTIVKLRYNTLVKEGNVNQNIIYDNNKKSGIKRKG